MTEGLRRFAVVCGEILHSIVLTVKSHKFELWETLTA
jgi:hypothetical protein